MLAFWTVTGVGYLILAISIATFALKVWALGDCLLHRAEAFPAAGKQTKPIWLGITGVAFLIHLVAFDPLFLLNIIGVGAAIVYLVDVRPALQQVDGGRFGRFGRGGRGPGGTGRGPTGW